MKKGFTLIELLAVLVLVGVLALIGSVSVTKLINSSKTKSYQKQINNIEKAAKIYVTKNGHFLQENDDFETYITIEEIQKAGYLPKDDITDPRNGKVMNGCIKITYDIKYKKYDYKYTNTCGAKINYPQISIIYKGVKDYIEVGSIFDINNMIEVYATNSDGTASVLSDPVITKDNKVVDNINTTQLGSEYVITYTALDKIKNLTSIQSLRLKVVDTKPPEIRLNNILKNEVIDIQKYSMYDNVKYEDPKLEVIDNSGENITVKKTGKVNTSVAGNYQIKYTATDSSKNKATYTVSINIKDPNKISFDLETSEPDGNNNWYKTNPTIKITNLLRGEETLTIGESNAVGVATCFYEISGNEDKISITSDTFSVDAEGNQKKVDVTCNYNNGTKTYTYTTSLVLNIDKTGPKCNLKSSNSLWTNEDVLITNSCSDDISGCEDETNKTYLATETGLYGTGENGEADTFVDLAGNTTVCGKKEVRIDKIPPVCERVYANPSTGWNKRGSNVTVYGVCTDEGGSDCESDLVYKTYSNINNSSAYPSTDGIIKDRAGNTAQCGSIKVGFESGEPYAPYISYVTGVSNISSIKKSCVCNYDCLIGDTCSGKDVTKCYDGNSNTCTVTVTKADETLPASFKISIGATEYADTLGASGIHYFNFKLNSSSYTKKTNEHLITIPAASNCTTSWTTNDKLYYLAVDKASNISEGYMLLSVKNANSGSCTVSLDVTP